MVSSSVSDLDASFYDSIGLTGSLADKQNAFKRLSSKLEGLPIYLYGHSFTVLTGNTFFTSGKHYAQKAANALRTLDPVSYGVNGKRILDVCSTLINGGNLLGVTGVIAAGKWPGVSQRKGLVVIDTLVSDIGHYPSMAVNPPVPTAITNANTQYLDGIKSMFRTALAILATESRVEQTSAVLTGAWSVSNNAAYSNGSLHLTSTVGDNALYTVTPPQSGPLAGKVFLLGYRLAAAVGVAAAFNVSVDGGAATAVNPTAWESYTNSGGAASTIIPDVVPITLPVDGNSHTIRITHAGAAGQFLYTDCVLVPSTDPYPVAVMGVDQPPKVVVGTFDANAVATWVSNRGSVQDAVKQVVQEFPHDYFVSSSMSSNGLYSGDGIHPNDRGMSQRASDLVIATQQMLNGNRLRDLANSSYAVL